MRKWSLSIFVNIPSSTAYCVFISQLIRYARASTKYIDFVLRAGVFQINFSDRDTFVADLHRHWGSSTVDTGTHHTLWIPIVQNSGWYSELDNLNHPTSEYGSTDLRIWKHLQPQNVEATPKWKYRMFLTFLPNLSDWCCMQSGDADSSWTLDTNPILEVSSNCFWRFSFVCFGSCFIPIVYAFGLWFSESSILYCILGYGYCLYLSLYWYIFKTFRKTFHLHV